MTIVCPQQWGFQIPEGMGSSDEQQLNAQKPKAQRFHALLFGCFVVLAFVINPGPKSSCIFICPSATAAYSTIIIIILNIIIILIAIDRSNNKLTDGTVVFAD